MRKSDYLELVSRIRNPYEGYNEQFSACPEREYSPDEIKHGIDELMAAGYRLYVHTGGRLEESFIPKAWEECSNFLDQTGHLPELVYCDEDRRTDVNRAGYDPFFKPDFSPDTLQSFFYVGGAFIIKGYEGEEFYNEFSRDDYLKFAGFILKRFVNDPLSYDCIHISRVLFHSDEITDYHYPEGISPKPIFNSEADNKIKIRAVILSKDNPSMLMECVDSLLAYSDMDMEYVVIDNGSNETNRGIINAELEKRGIAYVFQPSDFVYSKLCNLGAAYSDTSLTDDYKYLLLLNDDIILPSSTKDFPSSLVRKASFPYVGAVGVKLLYPGGKQIQHVGISLLKQGPSHKLCTYEDDVVYERGRNRGAWNVMAVTGACLLLEAEKFREVGGFDERLHISYTDVDLCMDLWEKGYYNVVLNDTVLIHKESVTRGADGIDDAKAGRLKRERGIFFEKHPALPESGDVFYNRNLTSIRLDYSPDYVYPWEKNEISLQIDDFDEGYKIKFLPEGKLLFNLDSVRYVPALFDDEEGYYEVRGWCIRHGRDMLSYEPCLLVDQRGTNTFYHAVRQYREDLKEVFPKERNVLLSGFVCRIAAGAVEVSLDQAVFGCGLMKKDLFGTTLYFPAT